MVLIHLGNLVAVSPGRLARLELRRPEQRGTEETRVDLNFFFAGMQNKETTASAWLATMLSYNLAFRGEFLKLTGVEPPLDPARPWQINVETELSGPCDVTLEDDDTLVFLEDKVSASAKTKGQFRRYHHGAANSRAAKQLVGIYLGPSVSTGEVERSDLIGDPYSSSAPLQAVGTSRYASAGRTT